MKVFPTLSFVRKVNLFITVILHNRLLGKKALMQAME